MAGGRPIVASDLPAHPRGPAPTTTMRVLVAAGNPQALAAGIRPREGRSGAWRSASPRRRSPTSAVTPGTAAPSGSSVLFADGARAMISERLLALVRCPECHGALRSERRRAHLQRLRAAVTRGAARGLSRSAAAGRVRASRRNISTRRCTPTRGTSGSRRRCSDRESATTCCARSWRRRPRDRVVDLGCGSGRALLWNRDWQARAGRRRHQPVLRARGARSGSICCSAICGGCRSPTARSPRPTRSTCSSTCRRRRCAACCAEAARVLAPGGALFVYTHVRKNAPIAAGLRWINALARGLERVGLIDMRQERLRKSDHLNPLARHSRAAAGRGRGRLPHREDPLLHADRRRLRREHPDADGRESDSRGGPQRAARRRGCRGERTRRRSKRRERPARRKSRRAAPRTRRCAVLLTAAMKLDLLLFGRIESGPVLRAARKAPG